jgi:bacteriocin-like protein
MSKHSATNKQVRKSTDRELTENELEHVSGGTPSAAPKDPPVRESISFPYSSIAWAY